MKKQFLILVVVFVAVLAFLVIFKAHASECVLVDVNTVCGAATPQFILDAQSKILHQEDTILNQFFDSYREGFTYATPSYDDFTTNRIKEFLASDEATHYQPIRLSNMVYRNFINDFFLDGRHVELPEFKSLNINADWVQPGQTVSLNSVVVK